MSNIYFVLITFLSWSSSASHAVWKRASCDYPVDIILALDASGSVLKENWVRQLDFAQELSASVLNETSHSRIGIIDFSMIANEDIALTNDRDAVLNLLEIMKGKYQNGLTHTQQALQVAKDMFTKSSVATGVETKILIIITDGQTTVEKGQNGKDIIREPAQSLKDSGVKIIAIAIQPEHNQLAEAELRILASEPTDQNVFHLTNYSELLSRLDAIMEAACRKPTPGPTIPPTTTPITTITPTTVPPTTVPPTTVPPTTAPPESGCEVKYVKVGCYSDDQIDPRPLPELIMTDKDPSISTYSGTSVDWSNWITYVPDLICRCAKKAQEHQYNTFGIQFFGECWSGPEAASTYAEDGELSGASCTSTGTQEQQFVPCENSNETPCVGKEKMNYVYQIEGARRKRSYSL